MHGRGVAPSALADSGKLPTRAMLVCLLISSPFFASVNHMELQAIVDRVAIQALATAGREAAAATADRPAAAAVVTPAAAAAALAPPASSSGCGCNGSGRAQPARPAACPGKCASDSTCSGSCGCGSGAAVAVAAAAQGGCAAAWEDEAAQAVAAPCDCEDVELCPSELWFVAEVSLGGLGGGKHPLAWCLAGQPRLRPATAAAAGPPRM